MKESLFKLDGIPPLYDESSVHLGLIMTENQDQVNILNVTNRIEKTEKKLFSMKFPTTVSNRNITFNYSAKLHNTFVKPSLTSGLSALTITGKPLTKLINSEKRLIRHMFNFRKKATVFTLILTSRYGPHSDKFGKRNLVTVPKLMDQHLQPTISNQQVYSEAKDERRLLDKPC